MKIVVTNEIATHLTNKDEDLGNLIKRYGLLIFDENDDIFVSIVTHIVSQMLSNKVAEVILDRIITKCGGSLSPIALSNLDRDELRSCGISYAKADFIKEFTSDFLMGKYDFGNLVNMGDSEVIKYLMQINGIGKWTAEMISLFTLGRKNIFSFDDVALKNGIMRAKNYKTISRKRFDILRKRYNPYCSFASLYFYTCNDDKNF